MPPGSSRETPLSTAPALKFRKMTISLNTVTLVSVLTRLSLILKWTSVSFLINPSIVVVGTVAMTVLGTCMYALIFAPSTWAAMGIVGMPDLVSTSSSRSPGRPLLGPSGSEQTIPRAELYAIFKGVKYGRNPQRIICDHLNHVIALLDWLHYGVTSFLNPDTPNVDIWRKIHEAVIQRGGLCADGPNMLTALWQPSHQRANNNENAEMRHLRRGNDCADELANEGRRMHPDVSDVVLRTKARYCAAKNWIRWVGTATKLRYDNELEGCDHDRRPKGLHPVKSKDFRTRVPKEARVLRRFPWASDSLGIVEYTVDIWEDSDVEPVNTSVATEAADSIRAAVRVAGNTAEKQYLESFDSMGCADSKRRRKGARFLPDQSFNESSELLSSDHAMGHIMMTAGIGSNQFYWCNLWCAYTGERARKLSKYCDRVPRKVDVVNRLRDGLHPKTVAMLNTRPRRLLVADVGTRLGDLCGPPCSAEEMTCDASLDDVGGVTAATIESIHHPLQIFFDDEMCQEDTDHLGLGFALG